MTFINFLQSGLLIATCLIIGFTVAIKGIIMLVEQDGWKKKILGFIMILIPMTLLVASCEWNSYQEKHRIQIENVDK